MNTPMDREERQTVVVVALVCVAVSTYLVGRAVMRVVEASGTHDVRVKLVIAAAEQVFGTSTSPSGAVLGLGERVTTSITSTDLSGLAVVLLAVADVVGLLAIAAAVACFGVFLLQVMRGEPFNLRAQRALWWLMLSASVGLAVWAVCGTLGTNTVLRDLGYTGFGDVERDTTGNLLTATAILVFIPVLLVFRLGGRLARETEGLV